MERLLVTGGAGFIGANFVAHALAHSEARVTVLDKLTYAATREALDSLPGDRLELVVGDVADAGVVGPLVDVADAVVHFAAESHNDNALADPSPFVSTNLVGTFTVLEAVRRTGTRLHHVSTDEVYGEAAADEWFTESSSYAPSNPYAATKAGADHLVRAWVHSYGIDATISTCANNYGPWQHVEKFIPRQITNLIDGQPPKLYGAGRQQRDWIHVADHSAAVWQVLAEGRVGETYLIGAEEVHTNLEIARMLLEIFERDPGELEFVADRPGHDQRYATDPTKVRTELGWTPTHTDLSSGLAACVDWYREHESWWRPVKAGVEARYAARGQ
ncbi:dTDP-glucose 4,6-dehydratase [Nocardioides limicola]|uniref:dTDP-glucose 4,6-dehydratase n=1 Tax=Nocardioides limicola TaxID=2803368 RepID=UPI00193C2FEE|nr:dTDP-glucose 4,6-dehydratase [Nocardioides sp. DJM-14]